MTIQTENDITPDVATMLRARSGQTQREFWEAVGSNQSSGHWFEGGKRKQIPKPIRVLIFLGHVAGFPIDVSEPAKAANAVRHGQEVAAKLTAEAAKERADEAMRIAKEAEKKAKQLAT